MMAPYECQGEKPAALSAGVIGCFGEVVRCLRLCTESGAHI